MNGRMDGNGSERHTKERKQRNEERKEKRCRRQWSHHLLYGCNKTEGHISSHFFICLLYILSVHTCSHCVLCKPTVTSGNVVRFERVKCVHPKGYFKQLKMKLFVENFMNKNPYGVVSMSMPMVGSVLSQLKLDENVLRIAMLHMYNGILVINGKNKAKK